MAVKSISLLILFFMIVETKAIKSACILDKSRQPSSCNSSSVIMVTKSRKKYNLQINASLCQNGYCIPNYLYTYNSTCEDICQLCKSLHISDCPKSNKSTCDKNVDAHLNSLCKNKRSVVTTPVAQPCPTTTVTEIASTCTTTNTIYFSSTQSVTTVTTTYTLTATSAAPTQPIERQTLANLAANTLSILILGALLALSIFLLVIIITGWVCTCVYMKKNKAKKSCVQSRSTDDTHEKYFENPTYDGTSMTRPLTGISRSRPIGYKPPVAQKPQVLPRATHTMYDAVQATSPKTAGKGQTYDVLDRGKVNGKRNTARNVRVPKGYSQLGLPDKDIGNNYHLINKENN